MKKVTMSRKKGGELHWVARGSPRGKTLMLRRSPNSKVSTSFVEEATASSKTLSLEETSEQQ
jgi:hypothetical protein